MVTRGRSNIKSLMREPERLVIASEAKQSRAVYARSGLPRAFGPRNDD
jgi:hypothetical protein